MAQGRVVERWAGVCEGLRQLIATSAPVHAPQLKTILLSMFEVFETEVSRIKVAKHLRENKEPFMVSILYQERRYGCLICAFE